MHPRIWSIGVLVVTAAIPLTAQAVLELDHFYIVVPPDPVAAAAALRRVGLRVDTTEDRHESEGTASIAAFFENTYLELLWVDSSVSVDSAHLGDFADYRRAAAWRESGSSPFGVGLHFLSGTESDLGLPFRVDSAPEISPETVYILLRQPAESLAPDLFIMPSSRAVTRWIDRYREREPALFDHPLGARRVTGITLHSPPGGRPRAADLDLRLVGFQSGPDQYLEVEFDGGGAGRTWDLRPELPLVLRR